MLIFAYLHNPLGGIFVKFSHGATYKQIELEVNESDKVRDIKEKIRDQEEIPVYCQTLKFNGKQLEHDRILVSYYDIKDKPTLDLEG